MTSRSRILSEILRVDHAGEVGANAIYKGQLLILSKNPKYSKIITHMKEQEQVHLTTFNKILSKNHTRPSLLSPLWHAAGYSIGVASALVGVNSAMHLTEAVETVIGNHYNDQLRELLLLQQANPSEAQSISELTEIIKKFRDEELEHLDTAVTEESHKAPMYKVMDILVKSGVKVAIEIAKKI